MSSSADYLEYVLDLLSSLDDITYKRMMGEFLLYYKGVLLGGIYDNRFLVKKKPILEKYHLEEEIPYPSAKPMYLISTEDRMLIKEIVESLAQTL